MASTTDKLKDLLQRAGMSQQSAAESLADLSRQPKRGEDLTDDEMREIEQLKKQRLLKMEEAQLKMFAALPEDIREEILKQERIKAVEKAYQDIKQVHSYPSGREEDLLKKQHGEYYKSYQHSITPNKLPPYKDLLETHTDVAAREILLNDKEKDEK